MILDMTAEAQQTVAEDAKPMPTSKSKRVASIACCGCGVLIVDQYYLRVAPDLNWHADCLQCVECHKRLDESCTCFVRDGKTYCREDYTRLFAGRCSRCEQDIKDTEFVMRAKSKMYHVECFRCTCCNKVLHPGDEFALKDEDLLCKAERCFSGDKFNTSQDGSLSDGSIPDNTVSHSPPTPGSANNNDPIKEEVKTKESPTNGHTDSKPEKTSGSKRKESKPTRVRTVLNEKQLHTLRTCYGANPRPDALMKEQLVEMTGLSPRVIRVWFQNKRCKDKKKTILIKQMQQTQDKNGHLPPGLHGMPMVASSPVQNDGCVQGNPVEVQTFQQTWDGLGKYPLPPDMEHSHYSHMGPGGYDEPHGAHPQGSPFITPPGSANQDVSYHPFLLPPVSIHQDMISCELQQPTPPL